MRLAFFAFDNDLFVRPPVLVLQIRLVVVTFIRLIYAPSHLAHCQTAPAQLYVHLLLELAELLLC